MKKEAKESEPEAQLPESPMEFITIRWADDGGVVLDLGTVNHYEAWGLLGASLREVRERCPCIEVRFNGEIADSPWDEEDEDR